MKKKAERQSSVDELQAVEEAYSLFLEESKLKAREENIRLINFNVSLAAEKKGTGCSHAECRTDCCEGELPAAASTHRKAAVELSGKRPAGAAPLLKAPPPPTHFESG